MTITIEMLDPDATLIIVDGRIDQTQTPQLEQELNHLLGNGRNRLIIDMTGTTYINSGGLRTLVSAWRKARESGGDVILFGLPQRIADIFAMVGFDKVFRIVNTQAEATRALSDTQPDNDQSP
ncbi:MAG: anti-sigma factor antagonist [Candidatus Thermofonsia bacterium]|nr:MAG: anti-sigma factor antagonist [Candidatus Thermofonsia bacterium]